MEPPFDAERAESAVSALSEHGFVASDYAASLASYGTPEPLQAYVCAASAALGILSSSQPDRLVRAAAATAALVDAVADWVGPSVEDESGATVRIACKDGCHYCCFIRANALAPEALAIAAHIDATFEPEAKYQILRSVESFIERASRMTPLERYLRPVLCPLNKDGRCTVYEVRPMACRIHHSYSVEQCRIAFDEWEENRPISRNAMRKACSDAIVAAFADVLDHLGIDPRMLELPEALATAMTGDGLVERVTAGDDVFSGAYKPEITESGVG